MGREASDKVRSELVENGRLERTSSKCDDVAGAGRWVGRFSCHLGCQKTEVRETDRSGARNAWRQHHSRKRLTANGSPQR